MKGMEKKYQKVCMNKYFIFIFVTFSMLFTSPVSAQEKGQQSHIDRETFQAKKNAFVTAELGLTPEEAAAFIPLSEELEKKKFDVSRECKKLSRDIRHKENVSDAEYKQAIQVCLEVKLKEAQLEKEYYDKFSKVLSPEKLYKYRAAEFKFARSLFSSSKK